MLSFALRHTFMTWPVVELGSSTESADCVCESNINAQEHFTALVMDEPSVCPRGSPGCRVIVSTSAVGYWKVAAVSCSSAVIGSRPAHSSVNGFRRRITGIYLIKKSFFWCENMATSVGLCSPRWVEETSASSSAVTESWNPRPPQSVRVGRLIVWRKLRVQTFRNKVPLSAGRRPVPLHVVLHREGANTLN